jgi:hypothetical protein
MSTTTRWFVDFQTPTVPFGFLNVTTNFNAFISIGTIERIGSAGVDRHSGVWATICEVSQPLGEAADFPFIGAAELAVLNVAPLDDGTVLVRVLCNWVEALHVKIQLLVCND